MAAGALDATTNTDTDFPRSQAEKPAHGYNCSRSGSCSCELGLVEKVPYFSTDRDSVKVPFQNCSGPEIRLGSDARRRGVIIETDGQQGWTTGNAGNARCHWPDSPIGEGCSFPPFSVWRDAVQFHWSRRYDTSGQPSKEAATPVPGLSDSGPGVGGGKTDQVFTGPATSLIIS